MTGMEKGIYVFLGSLLAGQVRFCLHGRDPLKSDRPTSDIAFPGTVMVTIDIHSLAVSK